MGQPAARQGDKVVGTDPHTVLLPAPPAPPIPTPLPHPFRATTAGGLSPNANILAKPAATVDSTAGNNPAHMPTAPGIAFQSPPANKGTIVQGSATVRINGKAAARNGDMAKTCNDPADIPVGAVVALGTVRIG